MLGHTVVLRWWTGAGLETVEDASVGRRGARRGWWVTGVLAVTALAGTWFVTSPDDVVTPGGTVGLQIEPDASRYVGLYYLSEDDLVIDPLEPVTVNGLGTVLWLCAPIQRSGVIGTAGRDDLDEHCSSVEPFEPGMVLAGRRPDSVPSEPYLLVEVIPTGEQPQGLCALDVTYRPVDGWRTGRQRDGGPVRVVVNEPADSDELVEPDEGLLAACRS